METDPFSGARSRRWRRPRSTRTRAARRRGVRDRGGRGPRGGARAAAPSRARVGGRAGDAPPRGGAPLHLRGEALARAGRPRPARDQGGVLAALAHAEDPATLRALAHAADVVAQSSSTTSTPWDELLPSLSEAASSPRDAHREAASLLLGNLAESMGAHLATHHGALVATLVAASRRRVGRARRRAGRLRDGGAASRAARRAGRLGAARHRARHKRRLREAWRRSCRGSSSGA